eukprot:scaffold22084_cov117-Isochrysis_galbana.AAC.4
MAAIGWGMPRDAISQMMEWGPHLLAPTASDLTKHTQVGAWPRPSSATRRRHNGHPLSARAARASPFWKACFLRFGWSVFSVLGCLFTPFRKACFLRFGRLVFSV